MAKIKRLTDTQLKVRGKLAEDAISGVRGYITSITEEYNGNIRYGIQPRTDDPTKYPDAFNFDHKQIKIIDAGVSKMAIPPIDVSYAIPLGAKVKAEVHGIEGIALSRTTFMNGCVHYSIQTPVKKYGDDPMFHIPSDLVQAVPDEMPVRTVKTGTGGPVSRVDRKVAPRG